MKRARVAKRVPKACYECNRRKVKCNKQFPCNVCISRGIDRDCHREKVIINGRIYNDGMTAEQLRIQELEREICELRRKLTMHEQQSKEAKEQGKAAALVSVESTQKASKTV